MSYIDLDFGKQNIYNYKRQWEVFSDKSQSIDIWYRRGDAHILPRFFVDFDEDNFLQIDQWEYNGFRSLSVNDTSVADFRFQIRADKDTYWVKEFNFVDVFAHIFAFAVVIFVFGRLFYYYNKWHFKKFSSFKYANLPNKYTDGIFRGASKVFRLGDKEVRFMTKKYEDTQPEFAIREMTQEIYRLREMLQPVIEKEKKLIRERNLKRSTQHAME